MDVHPPHEPVHSWRDALTHIAIMTVGLFIALMLEGLVEYGQHKHIVHEARANIRQELEDNHKSTVENIVDLDHNMDRERADIRTINELRLRKPGKHSLTDTMEFSSLDNAAWQTARDTGALAYMPYDEVQTYSDLYSEQDAINEHARHIERTELEGLAPTTMGLDFSEFSASEWMDLLRTHATTLVDLCTLKQGLQEIDREYLQRLGQNSSHLTVTPCQNLMS